MPIEEKDLDFVKETKEEIRWWKFAAWTLPFVALAGIFFLTFIGWGNLLEKALTVGAVIFFSVSVYWWWWAIYKITALVDTIQRTIKNFESIKRELIGFKKNLRNR